MEKAWIIFQENLLAHSLNFWVQCISSEQPANQNPIGPSFSQIASSETSFKWPPLASDHLTKVLIGSSTSQIAISEISHKWAPKPEVVLIFFIVSSFPRYSPFFNHVLRLCIEKIKNVRVWWRICLIKSSFRIFHCFLKKSETWQHCKTLLLQAPQS